MDVWDGNVATEFAGGNGTSEDPYQIATGAQLGYLAEVISRVSPSTLGEQASQEDISTAEAYRDKSFVLTNDLDLQGHEWKSIGNGSNVKFYFGGTFDGQNHCIYNLTSNTTEKTSYNGLFGVISINATVKNLGIVDANITTKVGDSSLRLGILADWVNNSQIINCFTTGTVTSECGGLMIGGLVGQCTGYTKVIGSYSTATVESLKVSESLADDDIVGGLIGQWENASNDSLISDCWFGGKINCVQPNAGVGGILGANFDFREHDPGVTIKNCFVETTDITSVAPENITWIAAITAGPVTNCYWPNDKNLTEQYSAVVKLVISGNSDPTFDQSLCGSVVEDFSSNAILASLNINSSLTEDITWVEGIKNPTFSWDKWNIAADYSKVDAAIAKIPSDMSVYTEATAKAVTDAKAAVVSDKNITEQAIVDGYATGIDNAVSALVFKPADYSKVDTAIAAIPADISLYTEESVKAVTDAKAAVVRGKNITEQATVDGYATDINNAVKALTKKAPILIYSDVSKNDWFAPYVTDLTTQGILNGYEDGNFRPANNITRGEFCKIMATAAKAAIPSNQSAVAFDDTANHWSNNYVLWAKENNIVKGNGNGGFLPDAKITREETATMLSRYAENISKKAIPSSVDVKAFSDGGKISTWATVAVADLQKANVINGYEDNSYKPQNNATRAEAAKMFSVFCKVMK